MTDPIDWTAELPRQWATLAPSSVGTVAASVVCNSMDGRLVRLGVDDHGRRELLVPMNDLDSAAPLHVESAVALSVRALVFSGQPADFLVLTCFRVDLYDLFDEFLATVLGEIVGSPTPVALVVAALDRWRDLLRARSAGGLDVRAEMGLFGELVVFEKILESRPGSSVETWRGPLEEPRDFELADVTIEVKAHGLGQRKVVIHGVEQLDRVAGKRGLLVTVELAESAAGRTISEVVASLAHSGLDSESLSGRLLEVGWHGGLQGERRWSVSSFTTAEVDSLPRLVGGAIAGWPIAGVDKVQYDLSLAEVRAVGRRGAASLSEMIGGHG